jgi:hypothetical protein
MDEHQANSPLCSRSAFIYSPLDKIGGPSSGQYHVFYQPHKPLGHFKREVLAPLPDIPPL